MAADAQLTFWLFHLPQFALAAIMYTLIGRYLLSLFFRADSDKVLWRSIQTITQPLIAGARVLTPRIVPDELLVLFAFIWALFARMGFFIAFWKLGVAPAVGG